MLRDYGNGFEEHFVSSEGKSAAMLEPPRSQSAEATVNDMNVTCGDREGIFMDGSAEEWAALEVHAANCAECGEEVRIWKSMSTPPVNCAGMGNALSVGKD